MDQIGDIINNIIDIIFKYGKFIIFVLGITFIIPITFYLWLLYMGFFSTGIAAGSSAALWMSSLGTVPAGSIFATIQSISTRGILLFLNPYMLFIECVFSLCFGIYIGYKYNFDIEKIIAEFKLYIPYFIKIINISFSVIIDGILGIIISILTIIILYLVFLAMKKIVNYINKDQNGYVRIRDDNDRNRYTGTRIIYDNNNNNNENIPSLIVIVLILITIIFIVASLIYGIYLGYKNPFEIIKS